jgi:hypothetical protein
LLPSADRCWNIHQGVLTPIEPAVLLKK